MEYITHKLSGEYSHYMYSNHGNLYHAAYIDSGKRFRKAKLLKPTICGFYSLKTLSGFKKQFKVDSIKSMLVKLEDKIHVGFFLGTKKDQC